MARRIRLDGPGVVHHVWIHGVDGAAIFLDADDHQDFVDRFSRIVLEGGVRCYGWALLSNHAHFLLQTASGTLSRVMQRLNTGHAVRINRRHGRRGYVFMDRFQSRIVEGDADLVGLVRYVHRNPLDAGVVPSLDALAAYPWCGHGALVGARPPLPFEAVAETLSLFDDDAGRARPELLSWMARAEALLAQPAAPVDRFPSPSRLPPRPASHAGISRSCCARPARTIAFHRTSSAPV